MISARAPHAPLSLRWWLAAMGVFAMLLTAGFLRPAIEPEGSAPAAAPRESFAGGAVPAAAGPMRPVPAAASSPPLPPSSSPSIPATAVSVPKELLTMPGPVPVKGTGTFGYPPGRGAILGTQGPMRRFRVAVERGSREDVAAFAAQVEATLGDERSWTGGGRLRLQRVADAGAADFTIYLATRETAGRMCARGGVNIRVGGRPYTSCRATGQVIINLDRWRLSARPYIAAGVPITTYRHYVINHEVGHELGRGHQACPKRGGPAPVMVQQTLTLRGCTPYAWPRRGSRELVGLAL